MRAVTLTHNDMDGMASLLMLMIKFKPQEYFFTNYYDMEKSVNSVIHYKRTTGADTLLIADLSFSDNKELLEKLNTEFDGNIFYVDHHEYPDGFWDGFTFKKIIDTTRCAAKILYEDLYLNRDIKSDSFKEAANNFIEKVNTWDCWKDTDPAFEDAMYANEMFNSLKTDNYSIVNIAKDQIKHQFAIFKDLSTFAQNYDIACNKSKADLESKGLIQRCGDITFIFSWDFLPKIILDEYKAGQGIVVAVQYGIFKVRINQHKGYTEEMIDDLRQHLTGMNKFCHLHAFTYKTDHTTPKDIVSECEKIATHWNSLNKS